LNNRDFVTQKFGAGQKGQERFINGFNNAVVHYILQNNMSNFNTPEGDVVELPESYHGIPVVEARDQDTSVAIKDGEIKIDVDQVIDNYKNKVFLNTNQGENSNATKGLDTFNINENPFPTLNTYVKYVTELAYLKTQHTPKSLANNKRFKRFVANNNSEQIGYEKYMSELALMKSYNPAFIMGKTKYSYTNMVMETITEFDSENLKDRFPILAQLSPVKNVKDVNVLELNNKADAKGNVAETYYKNLRQLADSSVRKSTNDFDSDRISEVFEDFSLMMFYQHGAGYSRHGFTKVLDPVKYLEVMSAGANSFLNNNLKTLVFDEILNRMRVKSPFKNYLTTPANYSDPQPMSEEEQQTWFSQLQDIVDESGTIEIEPEDVPEGPIEGPGEPSTQPAVTEEDFNLELTDQITILEGELADLEDMKQELLERSIPVLIANNLPKIKPESARRETGVAVGTSKDINPGLLSNNGVSVERAAELINEGLFYEESGFPEIDMQDIRSYIIDILQTGVKNFVNDYTKQDRIDNLKAEIGSLKQEMQNSKNKNTGIQLDIFNDQNAPEGLPPIDRSSTECE
jgi:hypothetical protein